MPGGTRAWSRIMEEMARAPAPRRRWQRRSWLALLSLSLACAKGADDGLSSGVVLGDASAEGGVGTDAGTGTGATDGGGSGSGQVDGTGDGADTTAGGVTDDGPPGDSSGEPPPICPAEPDDVPCEVCGKEACCAQYLACIDDVMCACALECYLAGTDTAECFVMCGASPAALDLFNCAAPACEGVCP